jgi:phosphotransferase system enzyme I (PtsP)
VENPELVGLRRLLKRLRDVMKGGGTAQARLDHIVEIIAQDMVAEVCSAYVLRAGEVLELFATKGLRPEAVHQTRLRVGEGLVGDIALHARPLALEDARSHPQFAYRIETGEEIYRSLLGVPIQRGGRVLGVLVVQNRAQRHYVEEDVEVLETIAMVLAELLAGGELIPAEEIRRRESEALLPARLTGLVLNAGLGIGQAHVHRPEVPVTQVVGESVEVELGRLEQAVAETQAAVDAMLAHPDVVGGGEARDVLEAYRMFAEDHGWLQRMRDAIHMGLTAEAAVRRIQAENRARMARVGDAYLRERLHDLEDLANRLVQRLIGGGAEAPSAPDRDFVLIARSLGPAELLDYDRSRLRALVMEEGTHQSHVAIVARALDVPVVGRVDGVLAKVESGDLVIVDGDNGQVLLRARDDTCRTYAASIAARARRKAAYLAERDLPAVTRDGVALSLNINAGLLIDLPHLDETGADGVGLYRTEIPFMVRQSFPDVAAQTALYRRVLDQAAGRPVVFRTLDVGGDKALPYWRGEPEPNPAMGWRAIRIGLDRPAILRQQLRALLRAAAGGALHVMFPMVADVSEFAAARAILDKELERERRLGYVLPERLRVGAMVEVPALLWSLRQLLARADFLSLGSNDLAQFLFASDRENPKVSRRYDVLSPPFLALIMMVVRECEAAGVPLAVCGEMAGHPLEAMALIGAGVRRLSMAPPAVGPVRAMIRDLAVPGLAAFVSDLAESADHSVRERLRIYASDHGVRIDV